MPQARDPIPRPRRGKAALQANTVAVLAFNDISLFHLSVPCLVFGEDRSDAGAPVFDLRVCAAEPGPLTSTAGVLVHAPYGLEGLRGAGTIIVPSWRDPAEKPSQALLEALRDAHTHGARIVGLCLGAFVLAHAGLLDARSATTHWQLAQEFAQRFPTVDVDPEVLYVDDGDIVTSAGTAAGLDCCLHLLRTDWGAEIANRVARRIVLAPHRQGGQAQYIERALPTTGANHRLSVVLEWVTANLDVPHNLDALAERAAMGRRTFTRHFKQITGCTVGEWLQNQRLALAQSLLESTDMSIEAVAQKVGLGSATSLRQHFMAALGTTPSAWRKQFK
jgi:transcriptional regulator GlxA family with amidase domain